MTKEESGLIDKFVCFLIRENCGGCNECDPRFDTRFFPEVSACCEEGRAKWFLEMAERFKADKEIQNE